MESELFEGLNREEKESFLNIFTQRSIEKGTTIKKEGEHIKRAFFLKEGEISISKHSSDEEMNLAKIQGGEDIIFSLDSLIDGGQSLTTIVATKKSTILEIEQKKFLNFCDANPIIGNKILQNITKILVRFLRKSDDKISEMYKTLEEVL